MAVPSTPRPRGVRVRTDLSSEAEFISAFQDLCDDNTIFAPTEKMKPIGASCAFSLELADGTPMVRGLGLIRNAWPMTDSPFGRPGIHIEIDQLTTSTEPIFQRMLEARSAAAAKPRTRPAPSTHQLWGPPAGPPTDQMEVQPEPEEPVLHKKITREIRGVDPLDLTDDARVEDESETKEAQPNGTKVRPPTIPGAPVPRPRPRLASAPVATISPPTVASESNIDVDGSLLAPRTDRPWWMNARVGAVFAGGIALGLLFSLLFRSDSKPVAAPAAAVAKVEPAKCPPPPEPTAVAAAEPTEAEAAPVEEPQTKARTPKASAAKPKQVAAATPSKTVTSSKPVATSSKPVATKADVTKTSPPTKPTTTKPATTSTVAAKTTTPTKTPTTTATTTKPSFASIKAATKPTTTTTTTTKVATTKTAPTTTKKPKKGACSSLDCL